jgi:hypothetical protein
MTTSSQLPGAPRPRRRAGALVVALFVAALLAPPARAADPVRPVFVASASRAFWGPVQWALGNQRRMLQVGAVGMCLAIYIILWRK